MARIYSNTNCPLNGTKYCRMLNMQSCDKCTLQKNDFTELTKDLDVIDGLMPEGGISRFRTTDKCVLCRGEHKNPAACYAMTDVGNPEPARTGRNVIGLKVKLAMGSIVTLQLACCKQCRKRYAAASGRSTIFTVIAGIIMLAILNYVPTAEAVASIAPFVPLTLFVLVVGGTFLLSRLWRKKYMEKCGKTTYFNVFDIPGIDEMKDKGWFEITPGKDMSKLVFSTELLKQGLYTGSDAENIENI